MKKSRILALGLSAALTVSLLAGCSNNTETQTSTNPQTSNAPTATEGSFNLNLCFASEQPYR